MREVDTQLAGDVLVDLVREVDTSLAGNVLIDREQAIVDHRLQHEGEVRRVITGGG